MPNVEIESLLREISPDHPSGESNLENDADFLELKEEIKGTLLVEGQDGRIIQQAKDPNWFACQEKALTLLERSHDLQVAVWLTRTLIHTEGLQGLRKGLSLICGFLDLYWDTVHPQLDPEDNNPIERVGYLEELNAQEEMISPLRKIELCSSRSMGSVNLRQYLIATNNTSGLRLSADEVNSPPKLEHIEGVFANCSLEQLQSTYDSASGSHAKAKRLLSIMNEKAGYENSPDIEDLVDALAEISKLCKARLSKRAPESFEAEKADQGEPGPDQPDTPGNEQAAIFGEGRGPGVIASRKDVLRLLELICTYYEKFEPASPVPLLLGRAMRLVDKRFMEIIEDLAPAGLEQVQLLRGTNKSENGAYEQ